MIPRFLLLAVLASVGVCYYSDTHFLQFNNFTSYLVTVVNLTTNCPTPLVDVDQFTRSTGHRGMMMPDGQVLEMGIYKNTTFVLGGSTFLGPSKQSGSTWGSFAALRNTSNKALPVTWATSAYAVNTALADPHVTFTTAALDQTNVNSFYLAGTACLSAASANAVFTTSFNISGVTLKVRGLFVAKYVNTSRVALWATGVNVSFSPLVMGITYGTYRYDCIAAFHKAIAPAGLGAVYLVGTTVGDFTVAGNVLAVQTTGMCCVYKNAIGFLMAIDTSGNFKWYRRLCMQYMMGSVNPDDYPVSYFFSLAYSRITATLFIVGGYRGLFGLTMSSTSYTATLLDTFWTPPVAAFNPFLIQFDPVNVTWLKNTFSSPNVTVEGEYAYYSDIWCDNETSSVYVAGLIASSMQLPGYGLVRGVKTSPVAFVGKLQSNYKNFSASELAFSYLEHDPQSSEALNAAYTDSLAFQTFWENRWFMTDIAVDEKFIYQTLAAPWSNTPFNSSAPLNTRLVVNRKTNAILLMINKGNFSFHLSGQHNGGGKYFPLGLAVRGNQAYIMSNIFEANYGYTPWGSVLLQSVVCSCYHGVCTDADHVCRCENGWNGTDCNTQVECGKGGVFIWKENKCRCYSGYYKTATGKCDGGPLL